MSAANDRNLLLGILALQMDFIDRDQLVDAMHLWVRDKTRPLDDDKDSGSSEALRKEITDRALSALEQAVDGGYTDVNHMRNDSDLEPLHNLKAFETLMQKAQEMNALELDVDAQQEAESH